jgi:hypothetical protein
MSRLLSPLFLALAAAPTAADLAAAPRYRMKLGADSTQGVKTVSLVQNPAIQKGWVALSSVAPSGPKRVFLGTVEAPHKQVITGPALIPGQEILRLDAEGKPFYIRFEASDIEDIMQRFAEEGNHSSTNEAHAVALDGNVMYESWRVRDPACDPVALMGIDVPAGTWMLSAKIKDADYWQNKVLTGEVTGFSIEGLFDTEQLSLSLSAAAPAAPNPSSMNWFQRLSAKLSKEKTAELAVSLGMVTLQDGTMLEIDDATGEVFAVGADGARGAAQPDGEYPLADGTTLTVSGGKQVKPTEAPAPELEADPNAATGAAAAGSVDERLGKVESAVAEILGLLKKQQPDPATQPAAQTLAAQLHGVAVVDLKLDAIELTEGETLAFNPVTKRLADSTGALVESGYYAAADGSYFQVSTDQYIWKIDKSTYDMVYGAKLQAVELADLRAKTPASGRLTLSSDTSELQPTKPVPAHLAFLASHMPGKSPASA